MICILSIDENKEILGWLIARDLADVRDKLPAFDHDDLAEALRELPEPKPGRYMLTSGHLMLVS